MSFIQAFTFTNILRKNSSSKSFLISFVTASDKSDFSSIGKTSTCKGISDTKFLRFSKAD